IYDRIEVIKGATGLLTGSGQPGAALNLIRKRPTRSFAGHVSLGAGSWDNYRGELDVGGPLTDEGNIRGRFVTAYQDKNSYMDRYEQKNSTYYGILEADLTPSTLFSIGMDYQDTTPPPPTGPGCRCST
ncbi:ferric-rhodotorulic acid/ferric-coprogen receptor FhuE, partial [Klebsiella pneumoniae]|uniref:TonB-dependent siderophore receptor n=1 Tax=Klebsiella pneumoniae TaxID=573 RepID=UPI001AFEC5B3|nr:ferric-rhodotorulic acid/ferric-coprogen receptor FhuE [Klebsiella pneumoniae]